MTDGEYLRALQEEVRVLKQALSLKVKGERSEADWVLELAYQIIGEPVADKGPITAEKMFPEEL